MSKDKHRSDVAIRVKVIGRKFAHIKPIDDDISLSAPVYAINWFDTNQPWLYNIYNALASTCVKAVGGAPYFKGRLTKVVHGSSDDRRGVLLIVRYPSTYLFARMLENRYFKIVSILRAAAVRNFTFGFTQRTDGQNDPGDNDREMAYAVHHYRGTIDIAKRVGDAVQDNNVGVYYSGRISSLVYSGDRTTIHQQIPCLMDGIIVLRGRTAEAIESCLRSKPYESIIAGTQSSFIGLFNRVL